ncbi:MAG: sodium ion-translocating decarboxylase subunit beta [Negativicutes bacterium]|nr:sodium ion-translocating decarboxylase subunit beta [Negativicutes bacterium]
MEAILQQYPWLNELFVGFLGLTWSHVAMWAIGLALIWLAIKHDYEPALLLPAGFGAILANIPFSSAISQIPGEEGFLWSLYQLGVTSGLFPVLILMLIGTMCDFVPLIRRPGIILLAAASQLGIFVLAAAATLVGFSFEHAAAIGMMGSADGPTTVFVASRYARDLLGPLAVAAYIYSALVPVIQPPIVKALTSERERQIRMSDEEQQPVLQTARMVFPLLVVLLTGLMIPAAVALVGSLMFGNILKEAGCLKKLTGAGETRSADVVTMLLGITVGGTLAADKVLTIEVAAIVIFGVVAVMLDTALGVMFAKLYNRLSKTRVNPMIGACGVAAFPLAGRTIAVMALKEDPGHSILQQALGVNVAGRLTAVLAGGLVLTLVPALMK